MQDFSTFPEEELLVLLKNGNRCAFKQLYVAYYHKIFVYALKFTKSSDLAEDIAQDVFIKIWENRQSLTEVKFFRGYLFTICKNLTLNILARATTEARIKDSLHPGYTAFHSDTENKTLSDEYERLLERAIDGLPPQRKLIFQLCKIEHLRYEEVACRLGISTGTVNDHIVKATRAIRKYLLKKTPC
ncbi:RNA polymerase sigma-70 factor [Dyadobacter arcticus]|uniref:RNA polymerase sigma-70 factor (ECF subfamily) n=1 Tax=Dyadobacter arcticus TaxID=1078754 RepID=A0ABX0UPH8_9BACT|nr:RNA polymerase sigma-70 factor [Dyadobacter arcticus]NIJ53590.1 RNA polymerase sigma-70 factor (ECF subfamily) [Dyadobacter arcticus]